MRKLVTIAVIAFAALLGAPSSGLASAAAESPCIDCWGGTRG